MVILLVGLMASFAALSIRGESPESALREEARRVLARMDLAREEAVLRARSLGVRFDRDGYRFFERRDGRWQALGAGGQLAPRELPGPIRIEVDVDGLEIALGGPDAGAGGGEDRGRIASGEIGAEEGAEEDADDKTERPQIFFLAGGEIMPAFTIHVLSDDALVEYQVKPGDEQWLTLSEHRF